jgi:hypothetical protein
MVNYTVEGNPSLMLFLWFLRPSRYWQWLMRSMLGIVIIWIVTDALYRYYFVPLIKQWEAGAAAADAKMALAEQKATEFEARFEERVAALNRRSDAVMKRMDEVKAELKQRSDVLKTDAAQFERSKTGK